jgi:hypothetical protein
MPTITILRFDELPRLEEATALLNGKKNGANWISARRNKYNQDEIFIQYWYYEGVESGINRAFSEEDGYEIVNVLKENGRDKILKRRYALLNYVTHSLEVYGGLDSRTKELLKLIEKTLKAKFVSLTLTQEELVELYTKHSAELTKVTFRNQQRNEEISITGKNVAASQEFAELFGYPWSLREICFRPKIKFMNEHNKYVVSLNGDKGTLRVSSNDVFQWRPRFEIRQLIFAIATVIGITDQAKKEAGMKVSANFEKSEGLPAPHNFGVTPTHAY